jgi:multisubunit Na+/H+ antiporter MnhE subunit
MNWEKADRATRVFVYAIINGVLFAGSLFLGFLVGAMAFVVLSLYHQSSHPVPWGLLTGLMGFLAGEAGRRGFDERLLVRIVSKKKKS